MPGLLRKIYSKKFLLIVLISFVILILPVIVFIWFFHGYSIGSPMDFADFANYYSGIVTPLLTIGSVIALVITLNYQRIQFRDQQNAHRLELLLARFDSAHEAFERITNGPFNHSSEPEAISLNSVFFIKGNVSDKSRSLDEAMRILPILDVGNYKVLTPSDLDAKHPGYGRYFLFISQVRVKGLSLINLYKHFSQFTTSNDKFVVKYLQPIVADSIYRLSSWKMISKEDEARYISDIESVEKSKQV